MNGSEAHAFCRDFLLVDRAVIVVYSRASDLKLCKLRIEALRNERTGLHTAHAYRELHYHLQPSYPQSRGASGLEPELPLQPTLTWSGPRNEYRLKC